MSTRIVFLVLSLSFSVLWTQACGCSPDHDFDFVLLAIQWPQTFCSTTHCVAHTDRWQIHGAWPENDDGSWPQNCCTAHPFNATLLKPIEAQLVDSWKTLKASNSNENFWAHEYNKHGSCAHDSPLLNDVFKYFHNTLLAFQNIHLERWLASGGIVPSPSKLYSTQHFDEAIHAELGYDVQLSCVSRQKVSTISQVNVCLDKVTLKPIDCPLPNRNCKANIAYRPTHK